LKAESVLQVLSLSIVTQRAALASTVLSKAGEKGEINFRGRKQYGAIHISGWTLDNASQ
jgi:hypothetical protein